MPNIVMADKPSGAASGISAISLQAGVDVSSNLPDLAVILFPSNASSALGCKNVDIVCGEKEVALLSPNYTQQSSGLKTINLHGAKAVAAQSAGSWTNQYGLSGYTNLNTISAKLRSSHGTAAAPFRNCNSLANVEWQENAQTVSVSMSACPLTESSLVSLANGLQVQESARTLTLSSARKTMCDSILGTVSQKTVNDVTYDFFTVAAGGGTTLTQFITVTKGWTLA